jgi:YD repeat-containing protein
VQKIGVPPNPKKVFMSTLPGLTQLKAGGTTTFSYDVRQRLIEQVDPGDRFLRYGYDAANNRNSIATSSGTTYFTYNKYKELKTVTDTNNGVTTYTYDKAGNLIQTNLPNGTVETKTYDLSDRLTQITSRSSGTIVLLHIQKEILKELMESSIRELVIQIEKGHWFR